MKKVLLTAGLVLAAVTASATPFKGTYVGVKGSYMPGFMNSEARYSAKGGPLSGAGIDVDLKGWEADLLAGQWFQCGDWSYALEGHVGRGFGKSSKDKTIRGAPLKAETQRLWTAGVAGRLGQTVANNVLAYGRLGLHANQIQTKFSTSIAGIDSKTKKFVSFAIAPGAGVEWALADNMSARFEYTYEYSMNKSDFNFDTAKISLKNPQTHQLSVAVSYAF